MYEPSGITDGIEYWHEGLDATKELEHHVSPAPPSQAPADTPVVLQTSSLTLSESVLSEAVVDQVIVCPGSLGASLLAPVKDA